MGLAPCAAVQSSASRRRRMRAHDHEKSKEIATRQYLQITKREVWYGKYYPAPGAPQKRVQPGQTAEMDEKRARVELDDIVAVLNRNPQHVLGVEPVRRFVEQVYIPQKSEKGDWRKRERAGG